MAIPRKSAPPVQSPAASADLLQILMFRKVLTREEAERVRRFARANSVGVIPTIVELKLASEVQVAETLAAFAGLRFVKINPLELDLDVVTGALSAAFARRHGLVAIAKTSTTLGEDGHEQRPPDLQFEPKRNVTLVRLRIDGMLHDVHVTPRIVYLAIVSRIKLLSGCNLAEKRRPQDGRIKREQGGREIELRVSTMPTAFGEKAVLRIFDPDILLTRIDRLGFSPADLEVFERFLGHTHGIILVTGPT